MSARTSATISASATTSIISAPVSGFCDPHFARVRDAFAAGFADGLELGAGLSVVIDGMTVIDLWGGYADTARLRAWRHDSLVSVWSATKGITALAIAMLEERGLLDTAAPVAHAWPDFAAAGKESIPLDFVLTHRAGLNGLAVPMDEAGLIAWTPFVEALAAMAPLWEPGSRYVYHAFSYGHILGEVLRRADGRSIGRFIAEEIAGPLGADFFLGLPAREEPRVAETTEGPNNSNWIDAVAGKPYPQVAQNPRPRALAPNDRAWRAAEIPGANGMATAHALARIYGVLAMGGARDGKRIIGKQSIAEATHPRFRGVNANFGAPVTVAAGFQLENAAFVGAGPKSFGHGAWGGAVGFCDPEADLGFGYVPNRMLAFDAGVDARRKAIIGALYDCL